MLKQFLKIFISEPPPMVAHPKKIIAARGSITN